MKQKRQSYYDCVADVVHNGGLKLGGKVWISVLADSSSHAEDIFRNMVNNQNYKISYMKVGNPVLTDIPSPQVAVYMSSCTSLTKEFLKKAITAITNGGAA